MNVAAFGELELTDATLTYLNQTHCVPFGGGVFQALNFRVNQIFEDKFDLRFTSFERFFGVFGRARFPFSRYQYVEGDLAVGGAAYTLRKETELFLASFDLNCTGENLLIPWRRENLGFRSQARGMLRSRHDTLSFPPRTGPIAGTTLLLGRHDVFGTADLQVPLDTFVP